MYERQVELIQTSILSLSIISKFWRVFTLKTPKVPLMIKVLQAFSCVVKSLQNFLLNQLSASYLINNAKERAFRLSETLRQSF